MIAVSLFFYLGELRIPLQLIVISYKPEIYFWHFVDGVRSKTRLASSVHQNVQSQAGCVLSYF